MYLVYVNTYSEDDEDKLPKDKERIDWLYKENNVSHFVYRFYNIYEAQAFKEDSGLEVEIVKEDTDGAN